VIAGADQVFFAEDPAGRIPGKRKVGPRKSRPREKQA
jgi:hypothetical protein